MTTTYLMVGRGKLPRGLNKWNLKNAGNFPWLRSLVKSPLLFGLEGVLLPSTIGSIIVAPLHNIYNIISKIYTSLIRTRIPSQFLVPIFIHKYGNQKLGWDSCSYNGLLVTLWLLYIYLTTLITLVTSSHWVQKCKRLVAGQLLTNKKSLPDAGWNQK